MIISPATCRAARGLLDWSQERLAAAANVGLSTIKNFEAEKSTPTGNNILAIQTAFEKMGVEFLSDGGVSSRGEPVSFEPGQVHDHSVYGFVGYWRGRTVDIWVPRETVDDAGALRTASEMERLDVFRRFRPEFEAFAADILRGRATETGRVSLDPVPFQLWRERRKRLGDRLRVPVERDYISALGMAVFAFARLEWAAVWCCERIAPNSINNTLPRMAGDLAHKLTELAATLPPSSEQIDLSEAAAEFKNLVRTRNALLHATPGSTDEGAQRLFRDGESWTVDMIDDAADAFTACNGRLVALSNGFLAALP